MLLLMSSLSSATIAVALTPDQIINELRATGKAGEGSPAAGKKFYMTDHRNKKGDVNSCSSCHTKDPMKTGKTRAGKIIEPMAISANKKRFTDKAKVEKWFKRNCHDVYDRECSAKEKLDFILFMKNPKI